MRLNPRLTFVLCKRVHYASLRFPAGIRANLYHPITLSVTTRSLLTPMLENGIIGRSFTSSVSISGTMFGTMQWRVDMGAIQRHPFVSYRSVSLILHIPGTSPLGSNRDKHTLRLHRTTHGSWEISLGSPVIGREGRITTRRRQSVAGWTFGRMTRSWAVTGKLTPLFDTF